jgi:hypothetical protein
MPAASAEQHCVVSWGAAPENSTRQIDMIKAHWSAQVRANPCAT